MALPADGSPMLEGHPDNGKVHGKLWLNEVDMVSEDHGEELRYSSSPQSLDCCTSSSGSSTTSSSDNEVGNDCTTSSNKDEDDNEDQDDFKSRLRIVQVLRPNIKFLWGIGVLEQLLKHLNLTIDQLGSADSSLTVDRADAASQLLEILPPNFKYIRDIGVAQKPQEDTAPCTSLEFTSGVDKQEEPILRPEKSRPIGTSQHHQVGLEEDGASLTSDHARSTTEKVDAAEEQDPPSKLSWGTVLPSSFKFTCGLDKKQEPDFRPEDFSPFSTSPQHLEGWKNFVGSLTFGRAKRTTKNVDAAKEEDPSSKPSHQVGLKEDMAHVTSVTGINRKRTKDSDAEEQPPAKRTKDTVAKEEPPANSTRDTVAKEELAVNRTKYSDDASWDKVLQRIGRRLAWRYGKEWEDEPIPSIPLFIPYRKTEYEDPILLSPVLSPSPRTLCEDPGQSSPVLSPSYRMASKRPVLSSPVLSPLRETVHEDPFLSSRDVRPSPSTHCENPLLSSPDFCFWMETEGDLEEEPTPSTSGGITARASSRHVWFRPRYVLSSDSD